jgi:hypothetical protein
MRLKVAATWLVAALVATAPLAAGTAGALALGSSNVTFATQSIPGSDGTSYVYFQATETSTGRSSTVPSHRFVDCPTPYYMRWFNVVSRPDGTTSYDAQMIECQSGRPVNDGVSYAGQLRWTPGSHPLLAGAERVATGRVIYDLDVALSPPVVQPNQEAILRAAIADDFVDQADRTLNVSVDPSGWRVTGWSVDFGDGQTATLPGGSPAMQVPHRYATPNDIRPVVTAHVAGIAQVADFDPLSGNAVLLLEAFSVDVTNSTSGQVARAPVVDYTPPRVRAGVEPGLTQSSPPTAQRGLAVLEAPRGTAVYLYVRPIVDTEGQMTLDGRPAGSGHTALVNWRLGHGTPDGPRGQVSVAGATGAPETPLVQQWDAPDRIEAAGPVPYAIDLDLTVRTTYPDGQSRDYSFSGSVAVTVGFAASSG